ncbi:MAG: hypothetical protein HZA20_10025 [Nitrospirae bacterium]|nr:hypothetical protein [Nitrospirota bacterium]
MIRIGRIGMDEIKNIALSVVSKFTYGTGYWAIIVAFLISRTLFHILGIRMLWASEHELSIFWQHLDMEWLKTDFIRSLYYLHGQPPLFNAFLGLVIKVFPNYHAVAFKIIYAVIGLCLYMGLYVLSCRFGVRAWLSFIVTLVFMISPSAIAYENWPRYTYVVASFLLLSVYFLDYYIAHSRKRYLLAFCVLIASVALSRSAWHLVWVVASLGIVAHGLRQRYRIIAISGLVTVLLVGSVYIKNYYEFGFFGTSSWIGMNVSRITTFMLPLDERAKLVSAGVLSRYALIEPFSPLEKYAINDESGYGAAAIRERHKTGGGANLNNSAYIEISRRYMDDAKRFVFLYPGNYLKSVSIALKRYMTISSSHLHRVMEPLAGYESVFNAVFFWGPIRNIYPVIWISVLLTTAYSVRRVFVIRQDVHSIVTYRYVALLLVYADLIFTALEYGENNKFRFEVEPIFILMLAVYIEDVIRCKSFLKPWKISML